MHLSSNGIPTSISDKHGRRCIYRSEPIKWALDAMPEIIKTVKALVAACDNPVPDQQENKRGKHWFSIFGHDRQNKEVGPAFSLL
jgi:hypothetical protein